MLSIEHGADYVELVLAWHMLCEVDSTIEKNVERSRRSCMSRREWDGWGVGVGGGGWGWGVLTRRYVQ